MGNGGTIGARRALVGTATLSLAFLVALLVLDERGRIVLSDLGLLAASLLAGGASLVRARWSDARRAWALAGFGILAWAGAQAAWTWQQVVRDVAIPSASVTDIGFALVLPLAIAAALSVPRAPGETRTTDLVDVVGIGVATLASAWAFLSPSMWPSGVTGHAVLAVIHPVSFVSAAGLTLYVVARRPQRDGLALTLAAVGMLVLGLANLVYGRLLVEGTYATGHPMDVAWFAGLLLIAAGAVAPPVVHEGPMCRRRTGLLLASPFLPVAVVVAAPLVLPPSGGLGLQARLALLVAVGVVFVRQHKLLLDNQRFAVELEDRVAARTAELAASESRLRLTAESGGVGMWEWDLTTDETWWSDELRRIFGVSPGSPASFDGWMALVHPDDRDEAAAVTAGAEGGTYRIVRPDGSVRWVLSRIGDETEQGSGRFVGVMVDVTSLREADARVVETLEAISDAYYAVDRSFRMTFLNRRAEELLGVTREQVLGHHLDEVSPGFTGSEIEAAFLDALATGEVQERRVWFEPHQRWYEGRAHPLPDGVAVYFSDVNERVAAEDERRRLHDELAHQAMHDPLTGLANRPALAAAVSSVLESTPDRLVQVLFIDVDRFKLVNDSLGHAAGDRLLRAIGRRLESFVRPGDVVARIGGDEFVIALLDVDPAGAELVADRALAALRVPVEVDGHRLHATASIGVASAAPGATIDSLLRDADIALYRAKGAGRDQVAWFDAAARDESVRRLQLEVALREAVERSELVLHYQPAYDLVSGAPAGAEALMRWQHPTEGLVPPGVFIPVAEESGLIVQMGDWAIASACAQARRWLDDGHPVTVWVNVSARQLARPGFAASVLSRVSAAGLPTSLLGLEVTESVLAAADSAGAVAVAELAALRSAGVLVAIDDFGTGFSSLARLRRLPVDVLKIDRSFVADLSTASGQAVVAAIVELAHAVGATTVAEGVEDASQLRVLRDIGCDIACGFHLARPVPASDLCAAMAAGSALVHSAPGGGGATG